jgi:hypothetical protein
MIFSVSFADEHGVVAAGFSTAVNCRSLAAATRRVGG